MDMQMDMQMLAGWLAVVGIILAGMAVAAVFTRDAPPLTAAQRARIRARWNPKQDTNQDTNQDENDENHDAA